MPKLFELGGDRAARVGAGREVPTGVVGVGGGPGVEAHLGLEIAEAGVGVADH